MTDEQNGQHQDPNSTRSGDPNSAKDTPNNQEEIDNKRLDRAYSKGYSENQSAYRTALRELHPELADVPDEEITPNKLKATLEKARKPEAPKRKGETTAEYEERLAFEREQSQKLRSENETLKTQIAQQEIGGLVARAIPDNVINPAKVAKYFQADYTVKKLANGEVKVYDENGRVLRDTTSGEFNDATVEYAMKKFLADNPHFLRGSIGTGAGMTDRTGLPIGEIAKLDAQLSNADKMKRAEEDMKREAYYR